MDEPKKIALSVTEAASAIGVSRPTMYRLIHTEGFPVLFVGGRTLIHREKLEEWAAARAGKRRGE